MTTTDHDAVLACPSRPLEAAVAEAVAHAAGACVDAFIAAFNARDAERMDALLHFPHVLFAADELHVWERPGQLPPDFFEKLAACGWERTESVYKTPLAVSTDKVHFLVRYARRRADGSVLTEHENLWIVTRVDGRWGIALRSY